MEIQRIELAGDYDLSDREQLSKLFETLSPDGPAVIDLTRVTYVDSTFLNELAKVRTRLDGHRVTLLGANDQIRRVLATVHFEMLFDVSPGLGSARG